LFFSLNNGAQSWCIGPSTVPRDAIIRVLDGALLPSHAASTWQELRGAAPCSHSHDTANMLEERAENWCISDALSGNPQSLTGKGRGGMVSNTHIRLMGLGMREYFSRVVAYREVKEEALKLKDAMRANEDIADLGGRTDEDKVSMRAFNRAKFKEVTRRMVLDCTYLSLEYVPKEICDKVTVTPSVSLHHTLEHSHHCNTLCNELCFTLCTYLSFEHFSHEICDKVTVTPSGSLQHTLQH